MTLYDRLAYSTSRRFSLGYSSSFGISSQLFAADIRRHIYAIYGLVRLAEEIVDGTTTVDTPQLLDTLEADTYRALDTGYSSNPLVHAFALTARHYTINHSLLAPFFASLRLDLTPRTYTKELYKTHIHGSAEVIGLMCLKVFCGDNSQLYGTLRSGAISLGAAYQKINCLRDLKADYETRGRFYFPGTTFDRFNDADKQAIIDDIKTDLTHARPALRHLPRNSRTAIMTSLTVYSRLLEQLEATPATTLKTTRLRVPTARKLWLLLRTSITEGARP